MVNTADNITILQINAESPYFRDVWDLREAVLRKPLGLSLKNDDLSRDYIDAIFIALLPGENKVLGCVFLHHLDATQVQLRAMAVYPEWQGGGIGRLLVQAAEKHALEKEYAKITLHARKVALDFYAGMGYAIISEEFTEVGIPHFMMEKGLGFIP